MRSTALKYTLSSEGNKNLFETIQDVYKLRGIYWSTKYALLSLVSYLGYPVWDVYYKLKYKANALSNKVFHFEGKKYKYFSHSYNKTWRCERAIEIPLIKDYLDKFKKKKVLEVGNVFSHYFPAKHDIVDNYEIAPNVINVDIMKYKSKKKYQVIFSISTLEHIGVDGEKGKGKAVKTIQLLKKLLSVNGKLVFTIPLGYNTSLDKYLLDDKNKLNNFYFFKRISSDNKWIQIKRNDVTQFQYGFPFRWGNIILLGIIAK